MRSSSACWRGSYKHSAAWNDTGTSSDSSEEPLSGCALEETAESDDETSSDDETRFLLAKTGSSKDICRSRVRAAIETGCWSNTVYAVILANVALMAIQCDHGSWKSWPAVDATFLVFFCVELLLRLFVYREMFCMSEAEWAWNVLDFALVVEGVVEQWLVPLVLMGARSEKWDFLRALRIMRLCRALRLIRHMPQLKLLIESFVATLKAVVWFLALFALLVLISSLGLATLVKQEEELNPWPPESSEEVQMYFGSSVRAGFTMFRFTTMDDWAAISMLFADRLPGVMLFFVLYILLTSFSVMALLTGVIAESVCILHAEQEQKRLDEQYDEYLKQMQEFFAREQERNPGFRGVSRDVLGKKMDANKVLHHRQKKHLGERIESNDDEEVPESSEDIQALVQFLDMDGDGFITWEEWRYGSNMMHGKALNLHLSVIKGEILRVSDRLDEAAHRPQPRGRQGASRGVAPECEARLSRLQERLTAVEVLLDDFITSHAAQLRSRSSSLAALSPPGQMPGSLAPHDAPWL
jgi:voltage-gated sodium channel